MIDTFKRTPRASWYVLLAFLVKVDEGDTIKRGQRIAEWDPYSRPILTEIDGVVGYEDLVDGASMIESTDEATGIAKRIVIDWRGSSRTSDLRPAVVVQDDTTTVIEPGYRGAVDRFGNILIEEA